MATASTPRKPKATTAKDANATPEDIARRAYEIFMARGAAHGHDVEHWLQAERELRQSAASSEPRARRERPRPTNGRIGV